MRSKRSRNKSWYDVSEYMDSSYDRPNNPCGDVHTHQYHNVVLLLLIHCIKSCMKEYEEKVDE